MWVNFGFLVQQNLVKNASKQRVREKSLSPIITTVFQGDLTLSLPVLLLVSVMLSLLLLLLLLVGVIMVVVIVGECSVRTW